MKTLKLLFFAFLAISLSSCVVSKKKYEIAENGRLAALFSCDSLADVLEASRADYATLLGNYNNLIRERDNLKADTTQLRKGLRNYQSMLNANQSENANLAAQLLQRQKELNEREETIKQLQGVINDQNARVKSLLDNVKSALTGFSSDELSVREEGGKRVTYELNLLDQQSIFSSPAYYLQQNDVIYVQPNKSQRVKGSTSYTWLTVGSTVVGIVVSVVSLIVALKK